MIPLHELVGWLDDYLDIRRFSDYAPNGLQVEGRGQVSNLVGGVTASLDLVDAAIAARADAILVHHGWFWKNEDPRVRGMKRARLQRLLAGDISLVAYHLPLDAHPVHGNNVQLARVLGIEVAAEAADTGASLLMRGRLRSPRPATAFADHIAQALGRRPLHIPGGSENVQTVAWCTGAAQDSIDDAVALGVDAYISGEISERTTHVARETGVHYYAAGHHATERYGVEALGRHLAERFDIGFRFIDIDNPV